MALGAFAKDDLEKRITIFAEALAIDPDFGEAAVNLGMAKPASATSRGRAKRSSRR